MTRDEALALMHEHTASEALRRHMYAVETAMRACARRLGEDEEAWATVGLLHDFDYEAHPNEARSPTEGPAIRICAGSRVITEKCEATSRAAGKPATGPSAALATGTFASASATDWKRGRWFTGWRARPAEPDSIEAPGSAPEVSRPRCWLLRAGWRRHGGIGLLEVPG